MENLLSDAKACPPNSLSLSQLDRAVSVPRAPPGPTLHAVGCVPFGK